LKPATSAVARRNASRVCSCSLIGAASRGGRRQRRWPARLFASTLASASTVPLAGYDRGQDARTVKACSTAAPGLWSRACAAGRCSCWWTASATPRRRRWPLTSASAIPSCGSVRPLGSATCSTTAASRRRRGSERLDAAASTALRLCVVAQDNGDGDELLRLLILAVLVRAQKRPDADEIAERVAAMLGVPPVVPERGHRRAAGGRRPSDSWCLSRGSR